MIEHILELQFRMNDVKNNNKNERKHAHFDENRYEEKKNNKTITKSEKLRNVFIRIELKSINVNIVETVLKLKCIISRKNQNLMIMIKCKRILR